MPSKLQNELNKLRGEVSTTGNIYTDSIALLRDALTNTEEAIEELISITNKSSSRINALDKTSQQALSWAKNAIRKAGDTVPGIIYLEDSLYILNQNRLFFYDDNNNQLAYFRSFTSSNESTLDINATPLNATSTSEIRFNRSTNTNLTKVTFFKGDGTTGAYIIFDCTNGTIDAEKLNECALSKCNVTTDTNGSPAEGDIRLDSVNHKLQFYNGSAWETVTSA